MFKILKMRHYIDSFIFKFRLKELYKSLQNTGWDFFQHNEKK